MAEQGAVGRLPADLQGRLEEALRDAAPSHRTLAAYFLANLTDLPFETAASVAARVGVSEATVGRFCRGIGYRHFKDLKGAIQSDLGGKAWLVGDRLKAFAARQKQGAGELGRGLEREMAAILANYETAASPDYARAVERLARRRQVFVSGFQTERGHGQLLVSQLQYLRPGVHLLDLGAGHFAELLLSPPEEACLVLIDGRRYSRLTRRLALAAREAGIPVTLVTDPYCAWAREAADEVLVVQTDLDQFWDGTSAMASLLGLMVNSVFALLGPGVEDRMSRVSALYNDFIGHAGDPSRPLK